MIPWLFALAWGSAAVAPPPSPAGTWRLEMDIVTESTLPVIGKTAVTTRSVALVRVEGQPGSWTQSQEVCDVAVLDNIPMSKTTIPQAFIRATPAQRYGITLTERDGAWWYRADPGPSAVGFDPQVTRWVVPKSPDAAGVLDFDGDGHPGATVVVQVPVLGRVEVYVAQAGHTVLEGPMVDGVIEGRPQVLRMDQETLGASHSALARSQRPTLLAAESRFKMVRVPDGTICGAEAGSGR
jgi:hypothetical protein